MTVMVDPHEKHRGDWACLYTGFLIMDRRFGVAERPTEEQMRASKV